MRKQFGLSIVTVLLVGIAAGIALLLGMKLVPVYVEYFSVKDTLKALVREQSGATPADIRDGFYRHATTQNITSVKADDLDIVQDGSGTTISVSYEAKVPLIGNASLVFDFSAEAHHAQAQ